METKNSKEDKSVFDNKKEDKFMLYFFLALLILLIALFFAVKFLLDLSFDQMVVLSAIITGFFGLMIFLGDVGSSFKNFIIKIFNKEESPNIIIEEISSKLKKEEIFAILEILKPIIINIENYIKKLQRNSIVNLFLGILGALTGVASLYYMKDLTISKNEPQIKDYILLYIPKLTFSILIQLFSFFFLRLYKNCLEDIKYFENELINVTAKVTAIKLSYILGSKNDVLKLLEELFKTERNFKLSKEETMPWLEKTKIESEQDKTLLENVKDMTKEIVSKTRPKK